MFELHVVVVGFVMLNILELIMEIVPNSPTPATFLCFFARNLISSFSLLALLWICVD
jgi:hypothetical protein